MKKGLFSLLAILAFHVSFAQQLEAYEDGGKYGIKESVSGKIIVRAKYDEIYPFTEGLAMVTLGGKSGYLDKSGKEVIIPQYPEANAFSEGLAAVLTDESWGFIDKTGKIIIPFNFQEANSFSEGLASV